MNQVYTSNYSTTPAHIAPSQTSSTWKITLRAFCSGLLLPFGFAPFHLPGLAILGLALLFLQLRTVSKKQAFHVGFAFAFGFFGFGVSWLYISIHNYGHLNAIIAAAFTLLFIAYLALYTGFFALAYQTLSKHISDHTRVILFSSLWLIFEYFRSVCFSGFPWLSLGFGQIDSPLQHLLPLIGVFGVSWCTACIAGLLGLVFIPTPTQKRTKLVLFVFILLAPMALKNIPWTTVHKPSLSVGVIQANLSMRDKWDESLFWEILDNYESKALNLIKTKQLVVMPESAIPLPSSYVSDFLDALSQTARAENSAILLGIPHPSASNKNLYHNALLGLGQAEGTYFKQHLVPFGEFIPHAFSKTNQWLKLPEPNLAQGATHQKPITLQQYPVAALICYELAYPKLLRTQLPEAAWLVSISDDGWFGRSFAIYQHLQMAQVLSKQTGRFQVVSNNSGLSSLINTDGVIIDKLPAFRAGVLEGMIHPATGATPWVRMGDFPLLLLNSIVVLIALGFQLKLAASKKRRYPNQPC